uniref:ATP synthase subunit 8 n=1 Tax=Potamilus streckersoni TaxID=2493646 RepID=A0A7U0FMD5_9BIVA|nr:ATP synthase F0 subunit 8 [Potamilus streckersoni]QQV68446.1 ATP synthase subunit 8 [Potamilus streckersoni]
MPQLSPMSWVLVFGVLLVCVILFMVGVWWGAVGEYKVMGKNKVGSIVGGIGGLGVKWGFSKEIWIKKTKMS